LVVPASARASLLTSADFTVLGAGTNDLSFFGTFTNDNDVALISFTLGEDAIFDASTSSGATGGFDAYLALLQTDATGKFELVPGLDNDDDPITGGPDAQLVDPLTGLPGVLLHAGSYTLALTQSNNFFNPATGGFDMDDQPEFTCGADVIEPEKGCFVDFFGVARSGDFAGAVTITPLAQPVPEPGTLALMTFGLGYLVARRRRKRSTTEP
jgi:hypothetical protein